MTADFCTWFLRNYKKYTYYGEEALTIKRRIRRISERPNPPTQIEVVELYQAFYNLYNVDIFARKTKKRPGIRTKTADYFLLLYTENTVVPFDYVAGKTRVVEKDLQDAVIRERDRKVDFYRNIDEVHGENVERGEILLQEAKKKFTEEGIEPSITLFFITAIVSFVFGLLLFLDDVVGFFGFSDDISVRIVQCPLILSSILFLLISMVSGTKYNYYLNTRDLVRDMKNLSRQLDENIVRLHKFNSKKTRVAIRKGKNVKRFIWEDDYEDGLKYFGLSMDLFRLRLTGRNPLISTLYYFAGLLSYYIIGSLSTLLFSKAFEKDAMIYIPIVATAVSGLIMIFLLRKIRFWKVFALSMLVVALSGLLMLI